MPRPKIYPTQALKQRAYRQRCKQRAQALEDATARIHASLKNHPLAGHNPIETLQNLAEYLATGKALPQTTRCLLAAIADHITQQNQLTADIQTIIEKEKEQ